MFERYTTGARRTIFFSRDEAAEFGSDHIDVTHLLLGLLREIKDGLKGVLPNLDYSTVKAELRVRGPVAPKISASTDLPLSNASKRALAFAAEEAERLGSRKISRMHLLLGLLRENHVACELLKHAGGDIKVLRASIEELPEGGAAAVDIHGIPHRAEMVRESAKWCMERFWHWEKMKWKNRTIVVYRKDGTISFDLSLANNAEEFQVAEGAWKKDYCAICGWDLFETDDADHGTGYWNGLHWVCVDCYQRFLKQTGDAPPSPAEFT